MSHGENSTSASHFAEIDSDARQRRDVERNHEAILSAAIAVLADTHTATMHDVAQASGVGRSTLYRHFPDRAALVAAIYRRVMSEAETLIHDHLAAAGDRDPVEVLAALVDATAGVGDRYRFLENYEAERPGRDLEYVRRLREPLRNYIDGARAGGAIRDDLDSDWLLMMLAATAAAAGKHRFADGSTRRIRLTATIRSLFAPPPRDPGLSG
jgi:AcrR family transcriptional regulator